MAGSTYKIIELVGTSDQSWEDAAKTAIETAGESLKDLRVAEVTKLDLTVENGKVTNYRTRVNLSFKYTRAFSRIQRNPFTRCSCFCDGVCQWLSRQSWFRQAASCLPHWARLLNCWSCRLVGNARCIFHNVSWVFLSSSWILEDAGTQTNSLQTVGNDYI